MYTQLTIESFRGFKKLVVPNLKRVNLFIGKNNVGKTSLLEAIFLHYGRFNSTLPWLLRGMRGRPSGLPNAAAIWGWLFRNKDIGSTISLKGTDHQGQTRSLGIKLGERSPKIDVTTEPPGTSSDLSISTGVPPNALLMEYENQEGAAREASAWFEGNKQMFQHGPETFPFMGHYLTPHSIFDAKDAEHYTQVDSLVGQIDQVVDILKHVDPRIRRISLGLEGGAPTVSVDIGLPEMIPLPLVGQGIVRLLRLSLSLCTPKVAVVLVDEIGNGIHYSAMPGMWKALDYTSEKGKIQIFATTHSRECAEAAYEAFKDKDPFAFALYRLERPDPQGEDAELISYDRESMDTAFGAGLEVR